MSEDPTSSGAPAAKPPPWNDPLIRSIFFQVLAVALLGYFIFFIFDNTLTNMAKSGVSTGFAFLKREAGFGILMSLIDYDETYSYGRTFFVGLLNTAIVAACGIVLATVLGFILGVARLSNNWLISKLAAVYIEIFRNVPLLLQIIFWSIAVFQALPGPRQSLRIPSAVLNDGFGFFIFALVIAIIGIFVLKNWAHKRQLKTGQKFPVLYVALGLIIGLPLVVSLIVGTPLTWEYAKPENGDFIGGFYLNNRGLFLPDPVFGDGFGYVTITFIIAVIGVYFLKKWAKEKQEKTGEQFPVFYASLGLLIGLPLIVFLFMGMPLTWEYAKLERFSFAGGMNIIPEFMALLWALTMYTAAFIAEIVRSGIQAVSHGQSEAAHALGLRNAPTLRLVIIPQAMRVIIPPLTSQYLNLTKNSSLATAIGYPDLVSVFMGTTLNQTGQAVEIVAMTMAVYLTFSLSISAIMNWYNNRVAVVER